MNLRLLFEEPETEEEEESYTLESTCDETNPLASIIGAGIAQFKAPLYKDRGCDRAKRLFGSDVKCKGCPLPECVDVYRDGYRGINRAAIRQQFAQQGLRIVWVGAGVTVKKACG